MNSRRQLPNSGPMIPRNRAIPQVRTKKPKSVLSSEIPHPMEAGTSFSSVFSSSCKLEEQSPANIFSTDCSNPSVHPGNPNSKQGPSCSEWIKGPSDPAGNIIKLSDRPSLCMSTHKSEAAIGSSDHAVYVLDVDTMKFSKALYGRNYGHTEWVTCVDHLPDGRIISGGMDNKVCLWDAKGVRCRDLNGHSGSISDVKVVYGGLFAVSSSYDKTLLIWDMKNMQGKPFGCLKGHKGAVMGFSFSKRATLISGSRDGSVILWDMENQMPILHKQNAHKGHVTALQTLHDHEDSEAISGDIFLTGGQDGQMIVWDSRARLPVYCAILHRSQKGMGALSGIGVGIAQGCKCPFIVTAGADKVLKVLDPRSSFKAIHTLVEHRDFIYSLYVSGSLIWSGGGDGSLLLHDLNDGKCVYGLGATLNGAARCMSLAGRDSRKLIITGDDGNAIIYSI